MTRASLELHPYFAVGKPQVPRCCMNLADTISARVSKYSAIPTYMLAVQQAYEYEQQITYCISFIHNNRLRACKTRSSPV